MFGAGGVLLFPGGLFSPQSVLSRFVQRIGLLRMLWGCAFIILAALILSLSRGGMIAAIAAAMVTGGLLNRRMAGISFMIVGGAALGIGLNAIVLLPQGLEEGVTDLLQYANFLMLDVRTIALTPENFSVLERLVHWDAAYGMWGDALWLGQGVGNYGAVYADYRIAPWDEALGHAHNLFLNTLAETGIIGLAAYLFFWGSAFKLSLRAIALNQGLWRGVALGTLGALIHLHIHNLFDNLYVHGIYLHLALILAMIAILTEADSSYDSRKKYDSTKATSPNRSTSNQS
jgi:O-antigen ligase